MTGPLMRFHENLRPFKTLAWVAGAVVALSLVLPACQVKLKPALPKPVPASSLDPGGAVLPRSTLDLKLSVGTDGLVEDAQRELARGWFEVAILPLLPEEDRVTFESSPSEEPAPEDEATPNDEPGEPEEESPPEDKAATNDEPGESEEELSQALPRPEPGGDYPEPPWHDGPDGRSIRTMIYPGDWRTEPGPEGEWVFELDLQVAAAAARRPGSTAGSPLSCACDGSAWCGGRKRPLKTPTLRWTLRPQVDEAWGLNGEPEVTVDGDITCKIWTSSSQAVDLSPVIEQSLTDLGQRATERLKARLSRSERTRVAMEEVWQSASQPTPHAHHDDLHIEWRPRGAAVRGVTFDGQHLHLDVQLQLRPVVTERRETKGDPLPAPAEVRDATGVTVIGELRISALELAAPLAATFEGRSFPDRATNSIQIQEVQVYGAERSSVIRFDVDGAVSGPLLFRGQVLLDEATDELYLGEVLPTSDTLKSLHTLYDEVETWNLDITITPWVDIDLFTDEVQRAGRWSLRPAMAAFRAGVEQTAKAWPLHEALGDEGFSRHAWLLLRTDEEAARILVAIASPAENAAEIDPATQ